MLDGLYETVVLSASNRGVDTTNWSFGKHVSSELWIANTTRDEYGNGLSEVSARWPNNQAAYYGLQGMVRAYLTIPTINVP